MFSKIFKGNDKESKCFFPIFSENEKSIPGTVDFIKLKTHMFN